MTAAPITSVDDVLNAACAKFCRECGAALDPPGSQCAVCGTLPAETCEEAAERLASEPDPVARAESARLREEAAWYLAAAVRVFRRADRVEHRSVLRRRRDEAQERLAAASGGHDQALAVFGEALSAEKVTAGPLAAALRVHGQAVRDEEAARRLRKGPEAETEAIVKLSAAARVLERYQAEATVAARVREAAGAAAEEAERTARVRESERDDAQLLLDRHAHVPLTGETVFSLLAPALQMAAGTDIDGRKLDLIERMMVGTVGDALHGAAYADFAPAPEPWTVPASVDTRLSTSPGESAVREH